jgi:hypothetical protein
VQAPGAPQNIGGVSALGSAIGAAVGTALPQIQIPTLNNAAEVQQGVIDAVNSMSNAVIRAIERNKQNAADIKVARPA